MNKRIALKDIKTGKVIRKEVSSVKRKFVNEAKVKK
jgi:hypothetical protein